MLRESIDIHNELSTTMFATQSTRSSFPSDNKFHLDKATTDYAALTSIQQAERDLNSNINLSRRVVLQSNNGIVNQYRLKCFYIALADALLNDRNWIEQQYRIQSDLAWYIQYGRIVLACRLAMICDRLNNEMFDTEGDRTVLQNLARTFDFRVDFYYGIFNHRANGIVTNPQPFDRVGNSNHVMRIIFYAAHFEHIIYMEDGFLNDVSAEIAEKVCQSQVHQLDNYDAIKLIADACGMTLNDFIETQCSQSQAHQLDNYAAIKSMADARGMRLKDFIEAQSSQSQAHQSDNYAAIKSIADACGMSLNDFIEAQRSQLPY